MSPETAGDGKDEVREPKVPFPNIDNFHHWARDLEGGLEQKILRKDLSKENSLLFFIPSSCLCPWDVYHPL